MTRSASTRILDLLLAANLFPTILIVFTVVVLPVALVLWSWWVRSRPMPESPSATLPLARPLLMRAFSLQTTEERLGWMGAIGGAGRVQPFHDGLWLVPNPPSKPRWLPAAMDQIVEFEITRGTILVDITFRTPQWEVFFSVGRGDARLIADWPSERKRSFHSKQAQQPAG